MRPPGRSLSERLPKDGSCSRSRTRDRPAMIEQIGVGLDIEMVGRFRTPDPRLFTAAELALCAASANPIETRAGRWCAKEAVVKAISRYVMLSPREVEILGDPSGRPVVHLLRAKLDHVQC